MILFLRKFFSIIATFLFVVFLLYKADASEPIDLKVRAENFAINQAKLVHKKAKECATEAQFIEYLKHEIKNTVAINYMALWVLGNNKLKFTAEQFDRFVVAFHNHLTEFYGSILYNNKDKTLAFNNSKVIDKNRAMVEFLISLGKQTILVDLQMRLNNKTDKLLVTDFIVNGISFLQAKRSEYNALFKKSGDDPEKFLNYFLKSNERSKAAIKNIDLPK